MADRETIVIRLLRFTLNKFFFYEILDIMQIVVEVNIKLSVYF
jgi:hypothetical protein